MEMNPFLAGNTAGGQVRGGTWKEPKANQNIVIRSRVQINIT